jgi:hypothetical protein
VHLARGHQARSIKWRPDLPQRKLDAIDALQIGVVDKLLFEFSEAGYEALEEQGLAAALLIPPIDGGLGNAEGGLLDNICEIYRLPGKKYLLGWIVGRKVCGRVGQASDQELCLDLRRVMMRYASDPNSVPLALGVMRTNWGSDPNFLGSYSCMPVGPGAMATFPPKRSQKWSLSDSFFPHYLQISHSLTHSLTHSLSIHLNSFPVPVTGRAGVVALGEPIDNLLFAGEATHGCYYGTVHGGWLSGEREARRILGLPLESEGD